MIGRGGGGRTAGRVTRQRAKAKADRPEFQAEIQICPKGQRGDIVHDFLF